MKKTKIVAVLTALVVMTSILGTACSKKDESSTGSSPLSSDTGVSLSIDPNVTGSKTNASGASGDGSMPNYVKMSFEDNYDQAAIKEMSKVVTIHGMQFTGLEYNYYFANEYTQLMSMTMSSSGGYNIPMTESGFLDMEGQLTEDKKIKDYLRELVVSDLQGEVFLLEYAKENNLKLDDTVIAQIDETLKNANESAQQYGITFDEYLQSYYGPEATEQGMREILQRYELVTLAMKTYVENYKFEDGEDTLPKVYHVLFPTVDLSAYPYPELSEEEQEAAKKKAEEFKASITSLDDMKTKGDEKTASGDAAEAAEYTVSIGEMVPEFEEWCYAKHEPGDVDIVKTTYGYHVMYYIEAVQADDSQKQRIAYGKLQAALDESLESGEYDAVFAN